MNDVNILNNGGDYLHEPTSTEYLKRPQWSSTSRDRILKVIQKEGLPDRVPVEIGIGPWYACQLLKATTVDLAHNNPSPQEVMLEAYRRYEYDPWLWATPPIALDNRRTDPSSEPEVYEEIITDSIDKYVVRYHVDTPLGPLSWELDTEAGRPTVQTEYPIKNPEIDWPKYLYWQGEERVYSDTFTIDPLMAGKGIGGLGACIPISWWVSLREGGITAVTYDLVDRPDLMDRIFSWYLNRTQDELSAALRARPRELFDAFFLQGSSSSLSHSSLTFFEKFDLPFIQAVTRKTKTAGLPSHLHVCGRSRAIVERCARYTDLDIIEPLEPMPGGDCDLGDIKQRYGRKLVLKGNLNTFQLMAYGTPSQIHEATRHCLDQAMEGGGYWLATGDQTPANTPEENILAVIETVNEFGYY